ncbi:MAG: acetoin dehydrogenase [Proteobacteria bacterium]|nr:MAG: acetoin dehydrogenase [Pseudomonadota bacterium]
MEKSDKDRKLFKQALLIRRAEEKIVELYPSDKIQSPVHLSIGQEAVAVGVCDQLWPEDLLFSTYRGHAFYLAKGGDLKQFFAELYGKVTGCARGKAGSMHLVSKEAGFMGCSAVVASTIPHAVGAAFAAKQLGKDHLSIATFGDGATDEGVYHECLNFASLHKLPVVFVCENNGLAVHSACRDRQTYSITEHAKAYKLPVWSIKEGGDFLEVREKFREVITYSREARAPSFVEVTTLRYKEHVGVGDDYQVGYRDIKELHAWQAKDPLIQDTALVAELGPEVDAEIAAAVDFAESSPWPDASELLRDVY